jgi:hypothetical protein
MELPKLPKRLSLEKLVLIGSNETKPGEKDERYVKTVEILKGWCGKDPFNRGVMGFCEEILDNVGREVIEQAIKDLEERGFGLNPISLKEALRSRGLDINPGFAELLYSCLKHTGLCIPIRSVFPSTSDESKIITFLRMKGSVRFSDIYRKVGRSEETVLNLLKRGLVNISYRGKMLELDGIDRFEDLSEEEVKKIPDIFLEKIKDFDGRMSYRIVIPLSARVSLRWNY